MSGLKSIVLSLCLASLLAGLAQQAAPSGRFQTMIRAVIGLFMLACVLSPFTGGVDWGDLPDYPAASWAPAPELAAQTADVMEAAAISETRAIAAAAAAQTGVAVQVLAVDTRRQEQTVFITRVALAVEGTRAQANRIRQIVSEQIDAEIAVQWTKET